MKGLQYLDEVTRFVHTGVGCVVGGGRRQGLGADAWTEGVYSGEVSGFTAEPKVGWCVFSCPFLCLPLGPPPPHRSLPLP